MCHFRLFSFCFFISICYFYFAITAAADDSGAETAGRLSLRSARRFNLIPVSENRKLLAEGGFRPVGPRPPRTAFMSQLLRTSGPLLLKPPAAYALQTVHPYDSRRDIKHGPPAPFIARLLIFSKCFPHYVCMLFWFFLSVGCVKS